MSRISIDTTGLNMTTTSTKHVRHSNSRKVDKFRPKTSFKCIHKHKHNKIFHIGSETTEKPPPSLKIIKE